jgi:hypothetical protein
MSEIGAVLVVMFIATGASTPTSVGKAALSFESWEACDKWRHQVRTQTLRDLFEPTNKTDTIASFCLAVFKAPPLGPCPKEQQC